VSYLFRFFMFWYVFVVGDDWTVAVGVVGSLAVAAALVHRHLPAWLWLPPAVGAVLTASLWRAARTLGR